MSTLIQSSLWFKLFLWFLCLFLFSSQQGSASARLLTTQNPSTGLRFTNRSFWMSRVFVCFTSGSRERLSDSLCTHWPLLQTRPCLCPPGSTPCAGQYHAVTLFEVQLQTSISLAVSLTVAFSASGNLGHILWFNLRYSLMKWCFCCSFYLWLRSNFWKKGVAFLLCQYLKPPRYYCYWLGFSIYTLVFLQFNLTIAFRGSFSVKELIKAHAAIQRLPTTCKL